MKAGNKDAFCTYVNYDVNVKNVACRIDGDFIEVKLSVPSCEQVCTFAICVPYMSRNFYSVSFVDSHALCKNGNDTVTKTRVGCQRFSMYSGTIQSVLNVVAQISIDLSRDFGAFVMRNAPEDVKAKYTLQHDRVGVDFTNFSSDQISMLLKDPVTSEKEQSASAIAQKTAQIKSLEARVVDLNKKVESKMNPADHDKIVAQKDATIKDCQAKLLDSTRVGIAKESKARQELADAERKSASKIQFVESQNELLRRKVELADMEKDNYIRQCRLMQARLDELERKQTADGAATLIHLSGDGGSAAKRPRGT